MLNSPFWRRFIVFASALFLGVLVLGGFLLPRTAFTQATTPQRAAKAAAAQCSLATLKGTYVSASTGVQIVGKDRVPFAVAGIGTYDGRGHVQAIASLSMNGKITRLLHFTGTYTVNPDCSATETDTIPGALLHFDEWITPDGSLLVSVQTDAGAMLSEYASRGTGK